MEESSQILAQQSQTIGYLLNILQVLIVLSLGAVGRILWNMNSSINKNKDSAAKEREDSAKEFVVFKEELAKEMAFIKSDLRSNTEQDGHLDKRLDTMDGTIKSLFGSVEKLNIKISAFIEGQKNN